MVVTGELSLLVRFSFFLCIFFMCFLNWSQFACHRVSYFIFLCIVLLPVPVHSVACKDPSLKFLYFFVFFVFGVSQIYLVM